MICLQITVVSEITHDGTRQETAEWTDLIDRMTAKYRWEEKGNYPVSKKSFYFRMIVDHVSVTQKISGNSDV